MNDIEDLQQKIKEQLQYLEKYITRSPLYTSQPKKWEQQCKNQVRQIKTQIQNLNQQIIKLPASQSSKYSGPAKKFKNQLQNLKRQFGKKLRGQSIVNSQYVNGKSGSSSKNNKLIMQTIQKGDNTQQRMLDGLDSMARTVQQGVSLAYETNLRLNQQIQQLDRMKDKVKDTESSLKRAQKHINYFMKALQCDKCLLGLIVMIILASITLIALIVVKHK